MKFGFYRVKSIFCSIVIKTRYSIVKLNILCFLSKKREHNEETEGPFSKQNTPTTEAFQCVVGVFCLLKGLAVSSLFSLFLNKHKIFNFTILYLVFMAIPQKLILP